MTFAAIRKHTNRVSILAFVALVFAVTGVAFAATRGGGGSRHATLSATVAKSQARLKTTASVRGTGLARTSDARSLRSDAVGSGAPGSADKTKMAASGSVAVSPSAVKASAASKSGVTPL